MKKRILDVIVVSSAILPAILLSILLSSCANVSPRQQFVSACATAGEAMAQVVAARKVGMVDDATYGQIVGAYVAAVETCATLPTSDYAAEVGVAKINEFLGRAAAAGVTGKQYPAY